MSKKMLAALVCAALLLLTLTATAEVITLPEKTSRFDITLELPEGAKLISSQLNGEYTQAEISKGELAGVMIGIAPSDETEQRSMADLSQEEMEGLKQLAGEQYENPLFNVETTPDGNLYLHLCSNEANDIDSIFTLYKGYFVELTQHYDDFRSLTEEDNSFLLDLLHGIEFVEAK